MNETILIVDDEKKITDLVEIYLKNDGYQAEKVGFRRSEEHTSELQSP